MKRYRFTVVLEGIGAEVTDAWQDAVECFQSDPGSAPDDAQDITASSPVIGSLDDYYDYDTHTWTGDLPKRCTVCGATETEALDGIECKKVIGCTESGQQNSN